MIDLSICSKCNFCKEFLYFERRPENENINFCNYFKTKFLTVHNLNKELGQENSKKKYVFARFNLLTGELLGEKLYNVKNDYPRRIKKKPIKIEIQEMINKYDYVLDKKCPYYLEQTMTFFSKESFNDETND